MRKITVIGGSGFIGTYLCLRLSKKGVPFEIIDLKRSSLFPDQTKVADIRDLDSLRKAITGQVVVHLAAVHRDDVRDSALYYETNVDGTRNICIAAAEKEISSLIFTSTVAVYGFAPPGTGENGTIAPFNDYGKSKFQAEEELRAWQASNKSACTLTIVRPTVVFGVGNRGNVYNLLNQIRSGLFFMIGRGKNVKSIAYVENIAAFLDHATSFRSGYRLVNYVDKPDIDMNTLVAHVRMALKGKRGVGLRVPFALALGLGHTLDFVARLSGKQFPISAIRVRKFCADTCFTSAAHEISDFEAPVPLPEGLERTLHSEFIAPDHSVGIFFTE